MVISSNFFVAKNSVFNLIGENKIFSISKPGHCSSDDGEEFFNKLIKLLELRSENDIELHVEEVRKKENQIRIEKNHYIDLSELDTEKCDN